MTTETELFTCQS